MAARPGRRRPHQSAIKLCGACFSAACRAMLNSPVRWRFANQPTVKLGACHEAQQIHLGRGGPDCHRCRRSSRSMPMRAATRSPSRTTHAAGVLYTTVDRADNKQFRELFTSPAAVEAAKKGKPLPSGTVITLVQYAAKLDAHGNPEKDANGRFIKGNLLGLHGDGEAHRLGHRVSRTMCATASGSIRRSRPTRRRTPRPISPPASTATSRSTRQDFVFSYDKLKEAK